MISFGYHFNIILPSLPFNLDRRVLERLRVELDEQLHRLHDSLNRLFDGGSRDSALAEDADTLADASASANNAAAAGSTDGGGDVTAAAAAVAGEAEIGPEEGGDSRIIAVVNPNYNPSSSLSSSSLSRRGAGNDGVVVEEEEEAEDADVGNVGRSSLDTLADVA